MTSISLTEINGWGNFFLTLLGALALSPSHGEVGGRFFCLVGTHCQAMESRGGRAERQKRNNRIDPTPPAEDVDPLERVTHAANAVRAVNTTDFTLIAPTNGPVVLTFDGATNHYVQLASEIFSDFRAASAEEAIPVTDSELFLLTLNVISGARNPTALVCIDFWNTVETAYSTSREFVCWDRIYLDELDFNFRAAPLGTLRRPGWRFALVEMEQSHKCFFISDSRDLVSRYLPIASKREGIV